MLEAIITIEIDVEVVMLMQEDRSNDHCGDAFSAAVANQPHDSAFGYRSPKKF